MSDLGLLEEVILARTMPRGFIFNDDNPHTPEIIPIESQNFHGPGILAVTIYEGLDLTVPSEYEDAFKHEQDPLASPTTAIQAKGSLLSISDHQHLPQEVIEFDSSQIHIKAISGTTENPVWEKERGRSYVHAWKFDVFRPGELTIRLYVKHPHTHGGSQDIFLGIAKMAPVFEHESTSQTKWLQINNGIGKLYIKVEYAKNKTLQIQTSKHPQCYREDYIDYISRVWKFGSNCSYASVNIQKSANISHSDVVQALLSPVNNNPFIAPLKFAAQTPMKLCLFWPFISGGYLLYHLQMAQRFQIDRARLYAAEIIVALEWLHGLDPSYHLEPRKLLLDSMGHVVLYDPRLIHLETDNTESELDTAVDYLAPELLTGKDSTVTISSSSKWWTLGVFLYEMLIGTPPFYNEDVQERRHNILSKSLEVSKLLPVSAQDLLAKLLVRNPKERLGANGASEIKVHPFFDELDWNKVAQREYEPAFKPPELTVCFAERRRRTLPEMIHLFDDFEYGKSNRPITVPATVESHQPAIALAAIESHRITPQFTSVDVEMKENWELVWDIQDQTFYFFNSSTRAKNPIASLHQEHLPPTKQYFQAISITHQDGNANIHDLPNEAQRHGALDAVLKNKCLHLVPALLKEYILNLNFDLSFTPQTPLEYITELGDVKIVELFLNNGADANASIKIRHTLGGRPLLYAVQQGNHKLVEILVQKTNRAPCTRALGHAITKQDISIINILLANGVKCDFEDSDRPLSSMSRDHGVFPTLPTSFTTCADQSEPAEYTPPLVRAVILGDENLVRLLLAHGADVNIGFHDLDILLLPSGWPIDISCGRPIQLAMELEHHNVVQLLLDNNADINLAQPVLQHHSCEMIPRIVYHQIISRLRSMALPTTAIKK